MSLDVEVSAAGIRAPIAASRAADIVRSVLRAERVRHALVSVAFVSRTEIAKLNRRHLAHRGATDVISFAFSRASDADPVIGDVYIAPAVAAENARARGVAAREELVRLIVHGTLHVLGYDHPDGDAPAREGSTMWRRQEQLVRRALRTRTVRGAKR